MTPTPEEKIRTYRTEKAIRVLCKQISDHCIATGLDQKTITEKLDNYTIQTTPQWVNEVWRVIMIGLTGKHSKKDLLQLEVELVYTEFCKFWSEVTGEFFEFPSMQSLLEAEFDDPKWQ